MRQRAGWAADFAATGKASVPGATAGDDSLVAGTATACRPDPNDRAELVEQLRTALAGVKSCAFELGGDGVQVDASRVDLGQLAHVSSDGVELSFDATDGWHMLSGTTVQRQGAGISPAT